MAERENVNEPKDLIDAVPEELDKLEKKIEEAEKSEVPLSYKDKRALRETEDRRKKLEEWVPKTALGKDVIHGKEKDIDKVLDSGKKILESEIVDTLVPDLHSDLIMIGHARGKFGGGKRRIWRQTQKKTMDGNSPSFSCMAVVGDGRGHVGLGYGKSRETLPAREKSIRDAKLNIVRITLGYESPEEGKANAPHTVPFIIEGKCSSVRIKLIPAPRGTGLVVADECKKILKLAGIRDVYSATAGKTRTSFNLAKACINALLKTNTMRLQNGI